MGPSINTDPKITYQGNTHPGNNNKHTLSVYSQWLLWWDPPPVREFVLSFTGRSSCSVLMPLSALSPSFPSKFSPRSGGRTAYLAPPLVDNSRTPTLSSSFSTSCRPDTQAAITTMIQINPWVCLLCYAGQGKNRRGCCTGTELRNGITGSVCEGTLRQRVRAHWMEHF